jgi:hypothetical protein
MIVTNVLVIGVLGNGFFGAGVRAVQEPRSVSHGRSTAWRFRRGR